MRRLFYLEMEPEYSEAARAAKFQGTVLLYVEIDPDGVAREHSGEAEPRARAR